MKIIALYSMKGGVGKSTGTANFAYLASCDNFQTLILDLDPQGSITYYFNIKSKGIKAKKFLSDSDFLEQIVRTTDYQCLDIIPSSLSYRKFDSLLKKIKNYKNKFMELLNPISKQYDLIFIDCPPGLSLISENIFNVSDYILSPMIPTTLSLHSYRQLMDFLKEWQKEKLYTFFSMVEIRKKVHKDVMNNQWFNNKLSTFIPFSAEIEKMGLYKAPIRLFAYDSKGAIAFETLWEEIKDKLLK